MESEWRWIQRQLPEPVYQQYLPLRCKLNWRIDVAYTDVAATGADPNTGVRIYVGGKWTTSAGMTQAPPSGEER